MKKCASNPPDGDRKSRRSYVLYIVIHTPVYREIFSCRLCLLLTNFHAKYFPFKFGLSPAPYVRLSFICSRHTFHYCCVGLWTKAQPDEKIWRRRRCTIYYTVLYDSIIPFSPPSASSIFQRNYVHRPEQSHSKLVVDSFGQRTKP